MPDRKGGTVTLRGQKFPKIRELFCWFSIGLVFGFFFIKEERSAVYQESEKQSRTFRATANDTSNKRQQEKR